MYRSAQMIRYMLNLKNTLSGVIALGIAGGSASFIAGQAANPPATNQVVLSSPLVEDPVVRDTAISYAIGVDIARHFRGMGINVIEEEVHRGLSDGLSGDRLKIPEKEVKALVIRVQNDNLRRSSAARRNPAGLNQYDADRFLEMNKKRKGVVSLPSGLQYSVLKKGKGSAVGKDAAVFVSYRMTYLDGTEFSASDPTKPVSVQAGAAPLKAWAEALPLMEKGAKWRLFVPPDLAYGTAGFGKEIGPNLGLIYDIEILER